MLVYVTCANQEEAEKIGRELVAARLAACVNILPGVKSFFHWENRLDEASETLLLAKTVAAKLPEIISTVKEKHSYSLPAILALPVVDGDREFLEWIKSEVGA